MFRTCTFSLTPKGITAVNKLNKVREKIEEEFLAEKLNAAEAKTLRNLLKKLMAPDED